MTQLAMTFLAWHICIYNSQWPTETSFQNCSKTFSVPTRKRTFFGKNYDRIGWRCV